MSKAIADAFAYGKLVLATTTYNNGIFPFMREFIDGLVERNYKNRSIGLIENGTWNPLAAKIMKTSFEKCKNIKFTDSIVTINSAVDSESCSKLNTLAEEIYNA